MGNAISLAVPVGERTTSTTDLLTLPAEAPASTAAGSSDAPRPPLPRRPQSAGPRGPSSGPREEIKAVKEAIGVLRQDNTSLRAQVELMCKQMEQLKRENNALQSQLGES